MAVGSWQIFDRFLTEKSDGSQDILNDEYVVILLDFTYVIDLSDTLYSTLNDSEIVEANGYITGGKATSLAMGSIPNGALFVGSDVSWVAAGGNISFRHALIANKTTNGLVAIATIDDTPGNTVIAEGFEHVIQISINGIFSETRQ